MIHRKSLGLALGLIATALPGCSGGGSNPAPAATAAPASTPTPTANPTASPTSSANNASFVITVPSGPAASAQSATVALGSTILATVNVPSTSSSCTPEGTSRSCTIGAHAPAGSDTFTLTAYDQPNGSGNVLATGTVTAILSATTPTTIGVSMVGRIAALEVTIENPYLPVGAAATTSLVVTAIDADGNTVLGAYASPITLADSDTTGATSLSATSVTSSSTIVTLKYSGIVPFLSATITAAMPGLTPAAATFAPSPAFLQAWAAPPRPPPGFGEIAAADMVLGPDGNMWAVAESYAEILKVTPSGTISQYRLSGPDDFPEGIVVGSDGDLWFAENQNDAIGKISPSTGVITNYALPLGSMGSASPVCVTLGKDGKVWFVDQANNVVGSITTAGAIAEFALPKNAAGDGITSGPDGNLWLADQQHNTILKISTSGALLATYPIPSGNSGVYYLAPGPDGNVWFTEFSASKIGRVTPAGSFAEYATPTGSAGPYDIVPGPDGRMWFGEMGAEVGLGKIGYITTDGSQARDFIGDGRHVRSLAFDRTKKLWYVGGWVVEPQVFGTFGY